MKIQCDVCGTEEASVFCDADEAALCDSCDRRVHRANKLAGKHRRFSLVHPTSPSLAPRCDVCQEKRAFLFCQEDRAILCRDCDAPIHTANELTMKHNRFLLTGVKLSGTVNTTTDSSESVTFEEEMEKKLEKQKKSDLLPTQSTKSCSSASSGGKVVVLDDEEVVASGNSCGNGSSISDYLTKTLPGWHVEDLLFDCPSPFPFSSTLTAPGFCKMGVGGGDLLPFMEADMESGRIAGGEAPVWWVPQVPQVLPQSSAFGFHRGGGGGGQQRWRSEDVFAVPQITSQQPPSNKRPRNLWHT